MTIIKKVHSQLYRHTKCAKGQALIEFAIVLPLLIGFMFGIIEFGRVLWVKQILTSAARAGVREASLSGNKVQATVEDTYIKPQLAASRITGYTINWNPSVASATAKAPITVEISVPFQSITLSGVLYIPGIFDLRTGSLTGACTMRKEEST